MDKRQQEKVKRFERLGYQLHCMSGSTAILIRKAGNVVSGNAVFKDGESVTIKSGDVHRFINQEEVTMKTYTRKQLEGMTVKELVALYNEHAPKPVVKFNSKKVAIDRILALASAATEEKKAKTKEKVAAKKRNAAKKKAVAKKTKARVARGESKMAKALVVFNEAQKQGLPRTEVLELFVEKVGLTKGGAPTYYQLCRKAAGLVG